jgi:alkanesulfonate monooxygenase SsuD/methylene tetrahydromethanopterin reductase-like flavin-dependent oxidoreductase (luciferase family)
MEGWTVLSALAAVTGRIRLATLHRRRLSQLALLADRCRSRPDWGRGRLTFGFSAQVGTNWNTASMVGIPAARVRIRQMEEAVRLIVAM